MSDYKGIIALDIDGTLTSSRNYIPPSVIDFLTDLSNEWVIHFITGKLSSAAQPVLEKIPFPYTLSAQNGAVTLSMPSGELLHKQYIDASILSSVDEICQPTSLDYVIYSGPEYNDTCYYRPSCFSQKLLNYLEERRGVLSERWVAVDTFESLDINEFASLKWIGQGKAIATLADKVTAALNLHIPLIRDVYKRNYLIAQATHPNVNKGLPIAWSRQQHPNLPVIVAGDDKNDIPMFEVADCSIVMGKTCKELVDLAKIIAPPSSEEGIIKGLTEGIKHASNHDR